MIEKRVDADAENVRRFLKVLAAFVWGKESEPSSSRAASSTFASQAARNYLDADFSAASEDKPRMNILMFGPPGTGKTEFVKYLGKELDRKVIVMKGSDLLSKYVGESEQNIANAFRARELALKLVKERGDAAVMVRLGWTPGDAAPAFREATGIDSLGLAHPIPAAALPPEEWFSIHSIVADLKLTQLNRAARVLSGYFLN